MQYIMISSVVLVLTAVLTALYCNHEMKKVKQQAIEYREMQLDYVVNKED